MKKFETEVHLSREMTLLDATMIGVGAMIGAGIFVLTGIAAGVAGPGLIIAFGLNGLIALLTAMSYAELGSCFHDAGGGYLWVKEGLPKWNGFLAGWMSWFAHAVACSLYALGFGAYFGHMLVELGLALPEVGGLPPQKVLAVGIAIVFAYINFRGASEAGKVGNAVTLAKIVILLIFVGFGLELIVHRTAWREAFSPFLPYGFGGVIKAMGLTFIAFQGFEVIAQCSEEIKSPRKNIPRAVFLSLIIVVPLYLLIAVTALGAVSTGELRPWEYLALHKETALVELAEQFFSGGGILLLFGGLISTMSALNATIYSSSRVAFAMGRDRNFPALFSKVHARKFTPHMAIVFSLLIVVVMAVALRIEDVASAADIMFLLLFLQVNVTLIRLRKKRPDLNRGFVVPLLPYLTILGIILLLFLALYMFNYSPLGWAVTGAWIALGLVVYKLYASRREIAHTRKVKALESLERREYRILVPVSNPSSMTDLLTVAAAIAKKNNGEVLQLHVIEVGDGVPLQVGLLEQQRASTILERGDELLGSLGVRHESILKVAHRISQGIVETAQEEGCNFVVLGRERRPGFIHRFFSSIIDSVIHDSPCEVAVLHGSLPANGVKRIILPFGDNAHTRLAMEMVPAVAEHFSSTVSIAVVVEPGGGARERDAQLGKVRGLLEKNEFTARVDVLSNQEVLPALTHHARRADLVVMGGRRGDFLELLFGQSLTQEITEAVDCPVLWVIEYEEEPSFWASAFAAQPKPVGVSHG